MRANLLALLAIAALGLAGCGEKSQEVVKTGKYQGKPDTVPWDSPEFGGKQAEWERAIQARTQNQNEYSRIQ
jgi:hypothetical protein